MTTDQPTPIKPVRTGPQVLACGHERAPGQSDEHEICPACFAKQRAAEIYRFEKLHSIDVQIKGGSPKAVTYARGIRYRVLKGLYERMSNEGHQQFLADYVDEFRRQQDARWFINRRFMSVEKLKASRKQKSSFDMSGLVAEALADAEKGGEV